MRRLRHQGITEDNALKFCLLYDQTPQLASYTLLKSMLGFHEEDESVLVRFSQNIMTKNVNGNVHLVVSLHNITIGVPEQAVINIPGTINFEYSYADKGVQLVDVNTNSSVLACFLEHGLDAKDIDDLVDDEQRPHLEARINHPDPVSLARIELLGTMQHQDHRNKKEFERRAGMVINDEEAQSASSVTTAYALHTLRKLGEDKNDRLFRQIGRGLLKKTLLDKLKDLLKRILGKENEDDKKSSAHNRHRLTSSHESNVFGSAFGAAENDSAKSAAAAA